MRLLHEETTTSASEAFDEAVRVAILPTGSVEQHGPALPLGTDFLAAEAVARGIDRDDAVVLPTVPVGVSAHHRQFDGTLWAEPETFEDYVGEIAASVANHGVDKLVFCNGHGGNSDALQRAARRLRGDRIAYAAPWNWWSSLDGLDEELFDQSGIGHADAMETSMVQHLASDLVREALLSEAEAGGAASWGEVRPRRGRRLRHRRLLRVRRGGQSDRRHRREGQETLRSGDRRTRRARRLVGRAAV